MLFLWLFPLLAAQPGTQPLYVLGPDDQLVIRALNAEEIGKEPYRVDMRGNINVPMVGRLHAAGLTVEQLEVEIAKRLDTWLHTPVVTVSVAEFRSQPVSVLGQVGAPGVHQIRGTKTLFEVLSLVGGLKPDAGNSIRITRRIESGPIPLPTSSPDPTGRFYVADLKVRSVMEAKNPQENIVILPHDVISVPKGEMVYVIGAVRKSGGFMLNEREAVSILHALSMAEGLERGALGNARILRPNEGGGARAEIPVNLKKVLAGQSGDVALLANDILFVPLSGPKNAFMRGIDAAITVGTGVAVYRR